MVSHEPARDRPSDEALFDREGTLVRLGGDVELLRDLIQMFAEDAPAMLERLAEAARAARWDEVRQKAHGLRGLAANFGAVRLTTRLSRLEESTAAGRPEAADRLMADIQHELGQLLKALADFR